MGGRGGVVAAVAALCDLVRPSAIRHHAPGTGAGFAPRGDDRRGDANSPRRGLPALEPGIFTGSIGVSSVGSGQSAGCDNHARITSASPSCILRDVGDRMLVDKNPALNSLIPAAARIFPEAKFLIALRDPRDVCLSCFMQSLSPNPISSSYLSLEGTVTQYLSVMGFGGRSCPACEIPSLSALRGTRR